MVETLQQDSTVSLSQHQQTVAGALAEATRDTPDAPAAADSNPLLTKALTSLVGGSIFSAAMLVREELAGGSKKNTSIFTSNTSTNNNNQPNSLFVGGGRSSNSGTTPTNSKASHRPASLVPLSYTEKKSAARDELIARTRITGMSLTGASLTGGKPTPIRGATITTNTSKTFNVSWLLKELAMIESVRKDPYAKGTNRLTADVKNGSETASKFVRNNPEATRNLTAQAQLTPPKKA